MGNGSNITHTTAISQLPVITSIKKREPFPMLLIYCSAMSISLLGENRQSRRKGLQIAAFCPTGIRYISYPFFQ